MALDETEYVVYTVARRGHVTAIAALFSTAMAAIMHAVALQSLGGAAARPVAYVVYRVVPGVPRLAIWSSRGGD